MSGTDSSQVGAKRRPGWRLVPWAFLLVAGAYLLLVGLWSFGFVAIRVQRAYPSGLVALSSAVRVEVGRLMISYAAIIGSGLFCWISAFRCRRGAWRSALYAALFAAALWGAFFVLWPGQDALPLAGRAHTPPPLASQWIRPVATVSQVFRLSLVGLVR